MLNQDVQTHASNVTRRRKTSDGQHRRTVFRGVLGNPFHVTWPSTPEDVQREILSQVVQLMSGVAEFSSLREETYRNKRKARQAHNRAKRRKLNSSAAPQLPEGEDLRAQDVLDPHAINHSTDVAAPVALRHLTVGINEVTKRLEAHARSSHKVGPFVSSVLSQETARPSVGSYACPSAGSHAQVRLVLVCRADINPSALVSHFPQLVASCNSRVISEQKQTTEVKLISLPYGSEAILSQTLGLKRAAVLALDVDMPGIDSLQDQIDSIPSLRLNHFDPALQQPRLHSMEPTHIKLLRTTAPKDMKAAKDARSQGRANARKMRDG